jgi:two-component system, cell cycle sensor histidine kinase and response regulator CckA
MRALLLESLGYTVVTKSNPVAALDIFTSDPSRVDLVITDMIMPHLPGDQLARKILKINQDMRSFSVPTSAVKLIMKKYYR